MQETCHQTNKVKSTRQANFSILFRGKSINTSKDVRERLASVRFVNS